MTLDVSLKLLLYAYILNVIYRYMWKRLNAIIATIDRKSLASAGAAAVSFGKPTQLSLKLVVLSGLSKVYSFDE